MAVTVRWSTAAMVVCVATLGVVLGGCGASSDGGAVDGGPEGSGWIATDLGSVPEGLTVAAIAEYSSDGRRIGYRALDRGPYGDDGTQVQVTTRVPLEWTVERLLQVYADAPDEESVGDIEGRVHGHRAAVMPATDDGRQYGWEVIWEESPAVQVHVKDVRRDGSGRPTATRRSALELAEGVRGLDRAEWEAALAAYEATAPDSGPAEGAVERPVADGVVDGRQWTLSVLEAPADRGIVTQSCFRLGYAGEDTGPGCSVQRVVLAGKGFVMGWTGLSDEAPELQAGPGSSFDPVRPTVFSFGLDPEWHVWLASLPDGACGVEYLPPNPVGSSAIPLDLLPGDPGAVECAGSS